MSCIFFSKNLVEREVIKLSVIPPPFLLPIGSILGDLEVVICIACWRKFWVQSFMNPWNPTVFDHPCGLILSRLMILSAHGNAFGAVWT